MTRHDNFVRYHHMLDSAQEAVSMLREKTRVDLDNDRKLNLSLTRLLEIIGEAANRVTDDERTRHPEIPWSEIVGLRNRLIHGYDAVDLDILWEIVHSDLPPPIASLKTIFSQKP